MFVNLKKGTYVQVEKIDAWHSLCCVEILWEKLLNVEEGPTL